MILTLEQLREGFRFFARRHGFESVLNETVAISALAMLVTIDPRPAELAAATFFSLASHPRCFPGATRAMTVVVTRAVAQQVGQVITASDDQLGRLVIDVAQRSVTYADIRVWFAVRSRPSDL